jgi:hypothetical protein
MAIARSLAVFSLLVLVGCYPISKRFAKSDVLGTYEIHYPFGTETLVLRDFIYEQRFVDNSGKVFTAGGKWTFDGTVRSNQGALEGAMAVCDGFGEFASTTPVKGYCLTTFAWYGGTVIVVNEDKDFFMRKRK